MSRCLGLVLCLCVIAMLVGGASAAQEPSPDIALLQAGAPDVLYQPSGSPGSVVPTGDTQDVRAGDGIAVSVGGWASLQFRDSLYVQIFHDSELRIESSLQPDPDAPLIYYFSMLAGTIFGERDTASIAQRRVIISTPNGVTIQPTGTRFLVYFEPATQTCWVVVKEGQVRVSAAGFDLDVPAGFQTWVEGDQAPQPPAPSGRAAIRTRFPSIDDLTGDMLAEADLLPEASGPDSPVGDAPGPATMPVMEAVSGAPKPVAKGPPVVQPPPPVEPAAAAPVAAPVVAQPVAAAPLPAAPSAAHAAPQPNHVGKQEANPSNTGDKTGKANKGDRGDKGEKGEKGDKGDKGHRGEEGDRDDDSD